MGGLLASNVIHDMGSSSGMEVRLTRVRERVSSSKANVNIAPGGVQVPTMRWWIGMLAVVSG